MADEHGWETVLKKLVEQMAETGVTELDVRRGDLRIRLQRRVFDAGFSSARAISDVDSLSNVAGETSLELYRLLAPLTGVFYAAPNPSSPPYVEAGDWVEEGSVVGLIETMKVFNEVTAECRGRVVAIQVQQGQLVQSGEVVALIDTSATPDQAVEVAS